MATKIITYDEIKTEAEAKIAALETANGKVPDLHDLTYAVATSLGAMGKLHGSTLMATGMKLESQQAKKVVPDEPIDEAEPLRQITVETSEVAVK